MIKERKERSRELVLVRAEKDERAVELLDKWALTWDCDDWKECKKHFEETMGKEMALQFIEDIEDFASFCVEQESVAVEKTREEGFKDLLESELPIEKKLQEMLKRTYKNRQIASYEQGKIDSLKEYKKEIESRVQKETASEIDLWLSSELSKLVQAIGGKVVLIGGKETVWKRTESMKQDFKMLFLQSEQAGELGKVSTSSPRKSILVKGYKKDMVGLSSPTSKDKKDSGLARFKTSRGFVTFPRNRKDSEGVSKLVKGSDGCADGQFLGSNPNPSIKDKKDGGLK